MTPYQQRVDEIAAMIAALPGAGRVHNRTRLTTRWADYLAVFQDVDGRINGWEVTRRTPTEPRPPRVLETFVLRHVYGLRDEDATDLTFQEHLDAAVRLFRDQPDLSFGSVPVGLHVVENDIRQFGDVLCHFAECELEVHSYYKTF